MPKPFDATLKDLVRKYPGDWLAQLGVRITGTPEVISADLSAVTAAADTLIKVGDQVIHIDVESSPDDKLARRMLLYNVLAHHHTGLPVHSIVVLLRSNAVRAGLSDRVEYTGHAGRGELRFQFELVRMWETPAETLLTAGVGFMPLAILGKPPKGKTRRQALPDLVRRIADRAETEAKADAPGLMMSAFLLSGMHFGKDEARAIFQGVLSMRESSTYMAILEEGATEEAQKLILNQGRERFGEPTTEQADKLKKIQNLERLERLAIRLLKVGTWEDLLKGR